MEVELSRSERVNALRDFINDIFHKEIFNDIFLLKVENVKKYHEIILDKPINNLNDWRDFLVAISNVFENVYTTLTYLVVEDIPPENFLSEAKIQILALTIMGLRFPEDYLENSKPILDEI